jgi:hypothetical protein
MTLLLICFDSDTVYNNGNLLYIALYLQYIQPAVTKQNLYEVLHAVPVTVTLGITIIIITITFIPLHYSMDVIYVLL